MKKLFYFNSTYCFVLYFSTVFFLSLMASPSSRAEVLLTPVKNGEVLAKIRSSAKLTLDIDKNKDTFINFFEAQIFELHSSPRIILIPLQYNSKAAKNQVCGTKCADRIFGLVPGVGELFDCGVCYLDGRWAHGDWLWSFSASALEAIMQNCWLL